MLKHNFAKVEWTTEWYASLFRVDTVRSKNKQMARTGCLNKMLLLFYIEFVIEKGYTFYIHTLKVWSTKPYTRCSIWHNLLFMPQSFYLPMTLENMNKLRFSPKKDYNANRLSSGLLQLSENTHLVLDETALQPGQLDSNGQSSQRVLYWICSVLFLYSAYPQHAGTVNSYTVQV